jgi:hypothetical protein
MIIIGFVAHLRVSSCGSADVIMEGSVSREMLPK